MRELRKAEMDPLHPRSPQRLAVNDAPDVIFTVDAATIAVAGKEVRLDGAAYPRGPGQSFHAGLVGFTDRKIFGDRLRFPRSDPFQYSIR